MRVSGLFPWSKVGFSGPVDLRLSEIRPRSSEKCGAANRGRGRLSGGAPAESRLRAELPAHNFTKIRWLQAPCKGQEKRPGEPLAAARLAQFV